jgi:uncharacterized protein
MLGKVLRDRLILTITRLPFRDELRRKGRFERIARAGPHLIRRLRLVIDGWPRWSHPLRVLFLSDFHTGFHSDDVARLKGIVAEARAFNPDLVLLGGDFVNMQLFGAGRVPPQVIAAILAQLDARYGQFAVLGNHDYLYGAQEVADTLRAHAITVLDDESWSVKVKNHSIDLVGIPNARVESARSKRLLAVKPKDEVEAMLAVQMAAVHMATITFAWRLRRSLPTATQERRPRISCLCSPIFLRDHGL